MYSLTVYNEPESGAWPNRTVGLFTTPTCRLTTTADSRACSARLGRRVRRALHRVVRRCARDPHPRLPRTSSDRSPGRLGDRGRRPRRASSDAAENRCGRGDVVACCAALRTGYVRADPTHPGGAATCRTGRRSVAFAQRLHRRTGPAARPSGTRCRTRATALAASRWNPVKRSSSRHHPKCRFWNLTLWNQYMAALDVDYGRAGINSGTAVPNGDGSVTIVVSRELLDHPNAISTKDHPEGLMSFRWFHADELPEHPTTVVVPSPRLLRTTTSVSRRRAPVRSIGVDSRAARRPAAGSTAL